MQKLVGENSSLGEEVRTAQENLRLSAGQNQKIVSELNEYKMWIEGNSQENEQLKIRMQKLVGENSSLGDEVRNAQENLRFSAGQNKKIAQELNEYKMRIEGNSQEN